MKRNIGIILFMIFVLGLFGCVFTGFYMASNDVKLRPVKCASCSNEVEVDDSEMK